MDGKSPELYDLRSDIGETKNVAAQYPEVVQELKLAIQTFQKDLDENSLEAPFDEGQAAYKSGKDKASKKKKKKEKK